MKKVAPPKVQKFPAAKQRRLDKLLDKNSEGTITAKEKGALEQLVAQAEQWMVANARRSSPRHINRHSIREIKSSCCSIWPAVFRIGLRPAMNRFAGSMGLANTSAVVR